MAMWNKINTRRQQVLQGFGEGINTFNDRLYIKDSEMLDSYNLCGNMYPSVMTRADRVVQGFPASTEAGMTNSIGVRTTTGAGTQLHKAHGNLWLYGFRGSTAWTAVSTAINASTVYGKFIEFNTMTAKYTILANSDGSFYNSYWDGATYSTFASTDSPRSHLMTAHKYRLYGIDNNGRLLRYSAQGDITDWSTIEDAGWIDLTDIVGKASAITTFNDHVIVWSNKTMYELYGSYWENFELVNISNKLGCVSSRAYCECNGKLYWMDYTGVYLYTGGQPRQIGFQAKRYIELIDFVNDSHLIWAGAFDGIVSFHIPYNVPGTGTVGMHLNFDVRQIDEGKVRFFTQLGGGEGGTIMDREFIACGSTSGKMWLLNSTRRTGNDDSANGTIANRPIAWMLDTKILADVGFNINTAISDVWIQHEGSTSATMSFGYWENKTTSSTTYTSLGASSDYVNNPDMIHRTKLLIPYNSLQNIDFYKFRISGTGYKKLHGLQINLYSYGWN
jgi:hypothetical protein